MKEFYFYCILASLLFILLGIVLALDLQNLSEKKISLNIQQLILGLILLIIGLVPIYYLILHLFRFDIKHVFIVYDLYRYQYAHFAINMIAGSLIGQSIRTEEEI